MELNVKDRLALLGVVPVEGVRMKDLRVANGMQRRLSFTEDEHARFKFQEVDGRLKWDEDEDTPTEIQIGARGTVIIRDRLLELDKDKKLTVDHVGIWELFECDNEDE